MQTVFRCWKEQFSDAEKINYFSKHNVYISVHKTQRNTFYTIMFPLQIIFSWDTKTNTFLAFLICFSLLFVQNLLSDFKRILHLKKKNSNNYVSRTCHYQSHVSKSYNRDSWSILCHSTMLTSMSHSLLRSVEDGNESRLSINFWFHL